MKRLFKKYKFLVLAAIITSIMILTITTLFFSKKNHKLLEYKNNYYKFQYDSSWKLEEKDNETILKHSKGTISIKYVLLDDDSRYKNLEEMSSQLFYDIKKQNKDYRLLAEESLRLTGNHYDGYRILFENDEKEVMVSIGKDSEKLFIITYEANSEYFDILLDSVESIIDYFTLVEEIFEISSKLNISTEPITWPSNSSLEKSKETILDEIANYNYIVKSKLPKNLQLTTMNSTYHNYRYLGLSDNQKINITTRISPKDIYSYLEDDSTYLMYSSYKKDSNSKFKEYLEESSSLGYNRYIYKNTYSQENTRYENLLLIYEINRNHTFIIEINATNIEIPKEWIEPIEIVSTKNYAGYTDTIKEENYQTFSLKTFKDFNYDKIEAVSLKIPIKWQEITAKQLQNNIYQTRSFGIDYLSKLDYYLYRVDYYFDRTYSNNLNDAITSQLSIEKNAMTYKYSYGNYQEITFYKKIVVNGNEIYCYKGGYTDANKVYVDMSLLFAKTDNGILKIKILGNNVKVSDNFLEEVSYFDSKDE